MSKVRERGPGRQYKFGSHQYIDSLQSKRQDENAKEVNVDGKEKGIGLSPPSPCRLESESGEGTSQGGSQGWAARG